jgi:hypothetical protein
VRDRIPPDPKNLQALDAQWRSSVEPSRTRHRGQIDEDMLQADHHLDARRIIRLPPLLQDSQAPTPRIISPE